jgi:hypothetical protein
MGRDNKGLLSFTGPLQSVDRNQNQRSCIGKSSTASINSLEATGPEIRYGDQSSGRAERTTSSPCLRDEHLRGRERKLGRVRCMDVLL